MPAPRVGGIKRWCASDVCLVAYVGPKSRKERPRKTKIGTEVAHITRDSDTTFKVKRSKVNLQGAGAYCGGLPHSLFLTDNEICLLRVSFHRVRPKYFNATEHINHEQKLLHRPVQSTVDWKQAEKNSTSVTSLPRDSTDLSLARSNIRQWTLNS